MRKKLTVLLPLYLASLILLVFSVFPHHHHDSFICFNTVHDLSTEHSQHHPHPGIPEKGCNVQYLFQTDDFKSFSRNPVQSEETAVPFAFFCCTLTEHLSIPCPVHSPDLWQHAVDDTFRQLLFSSPEFTRGPPRLS